MSDLESKKIIAMWSGPRNLSTAMMRSFGNRPDCSAMDEPFYAAYLAATGLDHPMRDEVIAHGETDPEKVIETCRSGGISDLPVSYQKHMTHHMIDAFTCDWISDVTNVFLIRHPARVLASYANKTDRISAADIGFEKQRELFELAAKLTGKTPVVIDAHDIRSNPERALTQLCEAIELDFDSAMLSWEPGQRAEDGIWASHWYDAVWKSTGFAPPDSSLLPELPNRLKEVMAQVMDHYRFMETCKITL